MTYIVLAAALLGLAAYFQNDIFTLVIFWCYFAFLLGVATRNLL
jgi:hypothetical protein